MLEHASDIIPVLLWLIVGVGGTLFALIVWLGQRLYNYIEKIPSMIAEKVKQVHDDLLRQVTDLNSTQRRLEEDMRHHVAGLDRRVIALEVRCDMHHPGRKEQQ